MATKTKQPALDETKVGVETESGNGTSPLSPDLLKELYYYMHKCRMVEERARLLFRQGKFAGNYYAAVVISSPTS